MVSTLPSATETNVAQASLPKSAEIPKHENASGTGASNGTAPSNASPQSPPPPLSPKAQQAKEGLAAFNDEPVVFYGKVVDQFNTPVPNATIDSTVEVNDGTRVGEDKFSLTSDANGAFSINGYKGKSLGIRVKKPGYVMATTDTRFVYSRLWPENEIYSPDANNPTVIKLWKLQGSEPLVGVNQRYKLNFTTSPVTFDLLAGKIVPNGGDITIILSRSQGVVSERTRQNWAVQIEVSGGGVIRTSQVGARVVFELPNSGYQPSDTFVLSTNAPHKWAGSIDQMYFLESRDAQVFGKIDVSVAINPKSNDYVWVEFHGEINPNGSRNFEADAPLPDSK